MGIFALRHEKYPEGGESTSLVCSFFLFLGILKPTVTHLKNFLCRREKDIGASFLSLENFSLLQEKDFIMG